MDPSAGPKVFTVAGDHLAEACGALVGEFVSAAGLGDLGSVFGTDRDEWRKAITALLNLERWLAMTATEQAAIVIGHRRRAGSPVARR